MPSMGLSGSSEKVRPKQCDESHSGVMSTSDAVPRPTEGIRKLFSGATMASSRGALVTVGQASCGARLIFPIRRRPAGCLRDSQATDELTSSITYT